jgi:hypothetical protein
MAGQACLNEVGRKNFSLLGSGKCLWPPTPDRYKNSAPYATRADVIPAQFRPQLWRVTRRSMTDYMQIFRAITNDARYLRNLDWGEARSGHPEGTIRAHIAEVDRNLEALRNKLSETDYWRLRVLIHTHDTFKPEAQPGVPISAPNSHASLARGFPAGFCGDADMLAMVQYHDGPYALWRQVVSKGKFNQERLTALLAKIRDWNLFLAFNIVDGCTVGKGREPLHCWKIRSNRILPRPTFFDGALSRSGAARRAELGAKRR